MIQVINRAFDILELCGKNIEKTYSLSEIADKLGINHTTCANILKTMVKRNYIEQVGYKKGYRLGYMPLQLIRNNSLKIELLNAAKDPMEKIVDELNETCIISVLRKSDWKRIQIHHVYSNHELIVKTAKEKNVYLAATGRIQLAYLNQEEIDILIQKIGLPLESVWSEATTKEGLLTALSKIRTEGIIIHHDINHIIGIAIPIFKGSEVVAGLGIYMPFIRFKGEMVKVSIEKLKLFGQIISSKLNKDINI